MKIPPIINPLSNDYNCLAQFKTDLSKRQKTAAIAAAIFASILPVFGTTAAFRKVVMHYSKKTPELESVHEADPIAQHDLWKAKDFVNFPDYDKRLDTDIDQYTLFKKLDQVGLTPENIRFERIWLKAVTHSAANQLFYPLESAVYGQEKSALYKSIPKEKNLIIFVHPDENEAKKHRNWFEDIQCLTAREVFGEDPLPKEFLEFIKKPA